MVKHTHHDFDIDPPGKDSWRHRRAGAFEVAVASSRCPAKIREIAVEVPPTVRQLLAELADRNWAVVDGLKHGDLPKIEVWRAAFGKPVQYPQDPYIVAMATDSAAQLPLPIELPLLDLGAPAAVTTFLLENSARHEYTAPEDRFALADAGRGAGAAA